MSLQIADADFELRRRFKHDAVRYSHHFGGAPVRGLFGSSFSRFNKSARRFSERSAASGLDIQRLLISLTVVSIGKFGAFSLFLAAEAAKGGEPQKQKNGGCRLGTYDAVVTDHV